MTILTNPDNYNIAFTIASLVVIVVALVVHISEDSQYNRQKNIFGAILLDALVLNCMGLLHNVWKYSDFAKGFISYQMNNNIVIVEKICAYALAYFSMLYVMSVFRVEAKGAIAHVILAAPVVYTIGVFLSGFVTDFFFFFDLEGELVHRQPQGYTVNISVLLYFLFATYLYLKYCRSLSTEKFIALLIYYGLMLAAIPIRILTKSNSVFEFSVSLAILLCVYTFQNPSEFSDRISGAGTRNALIFAVSNNLLQKKTFTVFGINVERLDVILGGDSIEAASELLTQITSYLKQLCPDGSVYYPDETAFMMIFPDVLPDDPIIEKTADLIKKRFREPFMFGHNKVKLFESPFVIGLPDEVDSVDKFNEVRGIIRKTLLRHNRDLLRVSDLNLKHVSHDKKIDGILKHALEDKLFEVYYQPIYDPARDVYSSCEALLRLRDPQLGTISPGVFMPIAEKNGRVLDIDRFVLGEVCDMLANTQAVDLGIQYAEVNLSVVDCIQTNMPEIILDTMDKYGIRPDQLNFEITETYSKGINNVMYENIGKLCSKGISFSMDDFGTGYSNISRIADLPMNIFKLDKSIVQSAFESGDAYMIIMNLIKIIKSIGKEIVAEGVETEEQADQIIRLGCDHIQGFYYARPMPKAQFIEFLKTHNSKENVANITSSL